MPRLVLWLLLYLDEDGFVVMAPVCAMLGSMIGCVLLCSVLLADLAQIYVSGPGLARLESCLDQQAHSRKIYRLAARPRRQRFCSGGYLANLREHYAIVINRVSELVVIEYKVWE